MTMKRGIIGVLLTVVGAWCGQTSAADARAAKINVAVVGDPGLPPALVALGGHRDIRATQATHADVFGGLDAWPYEVIVLWTMPEDLAPPHRANFLKLLDRGIGVVAVHHALAGYRNWPAYEKILGGRYHWKPRTEAGKQLPTSGGAHDQDFKITPARPDHPITRGIEPFSVHDEAMARLSHLPGNEVILTTEHPKSDKAIGWTRAYGKSRICVITPGHGPTIYAQWQFRHLLSQAVRWTARRDTLGPDEIESDPLEIAWRDLVGYEHGQSRHALLLLEKRVRQTGANLPARRQLIGRLVPVMNDPESTIAAKEFIAKQLMRVGGEQVVPALAKLIGKDENVAYLGRYALERIGHPAASGALREALGRTDGLVRIGVIHSLGNRRDREAAAPLADLLSSKDEPTARAAGWSLGRIGGLRAIKALTDAESDAPPPVRSAIVHALREAPAP